MGGPALSFSSVKQMNHRLADIAEIRSGYQFRAKVEHDPRGRVPVIQIKDLSSHFRLSTNDLIRVSMDKFEPYLVREGDVLFLARGHRLGAAPVTAPLTGTIATGYFFILRPSDRVRSKFLAWAINQKEFQDRMRPLVRGSHIPLITKRDFEELTLDVPPLGVQKLIETIDELHRREQELVEQLEQKRAEMVHAICARAAKSGPARRED